MWIGIGNTILRCGGGVIVDPDLATYMAGLSTPLNTSQKTLLNSFYITIKSGLGLTNIYDYFDIIYILGGETKESSYRNLVKRAHDITVTFEPTWTAFEGSRGNGSTQFLNSNYNPSTHGINYTQNNASLGIYSRTDKSANMRDIGVYDGVAISSFMFKAVDDNFFCTLNDGAGYIWGAIYTNTLGLFMLTRNNNTAVDQYLYYNKTLVNKTVSAGNTTGVPNVNLYICGCNLNGTLLNPSDRQLSFAFAGKYITTAMRDVIVDAFETYMDANGKGVI